MGVHLEPSLDKLSLWRRCRTVECCLNRWPYVVPRHGAIDRARRNPLKVKAGQYLTRANYDNLTDKLMSVFQHELFHNLQRNIELHNGGNGDLDGRMAPESISPKVRLCWLPRLENSV